MCFTNGVTLNSNIAFSEKCKSPFLAKDYQEVTKACFRSIHNASRAELQNCVHRDVPDFVLPQDEAGSLEMR